MSFRVRSNKVTKQICARRCFSIQGSKEFCPSFSHMEDKSEGE